MKTSIETRFLALKNLASGELQYLLSQVRLGCFISEGLFYFTLGIGEMDKSLFVIPILWLLQNKGRISLNNLFQSEEEYLGFNFKFD